MGLVNISLETFGLCVTMLLLFCSINEYKNKAMGSGLMMAMLFVNAAVLLCDLFTFVLSGSNYTVTLYILNSFVYILGYVMTALFTYYIFICISDKPPMFAHVVSVLCLIASVLVVISLGNKMYFKFVDGIYVRGPYYWISQVFPIIIIALDMIVILIYRKKIGSGNVFPLFSYGILPIVAMAIQIKIYGITLLYLATTLSLLTIYIMINVKNAGKIKEQELEITQSKISLMISQIQPHFLFNSLNTIEVLCSENPAAAETAVRSFSKYLRSNLDSLTSTPMISFEKELDHVKQYLILERYRFDNINYKFDINYKDFFLPSLSLQPIVENAVKHGVTQNKDGGTIIISSKRNRDSCVITVSDDGPGFDTQASVVDDGRTHVGISNVRSRIEILCGGSLDIKSCKGTGTVATITIPSGGLE